MRLSLAHDSFTQAGGAERVVAAWHEQFPEAPVATLVVDKNYPLALKGWKITTSVLQPFYKIYPHFKHFLPLLVCGVRSLRFPEDTEIVLSSSSLFLKGLRLPKNTVHVNYCHTPVRFLWIEPEYLKQEVPLVLQPPARWYLKQLRRWDWRAAQRVDYFLANSREVQQRIKKFYGRDSTIVYPFVDCAFWQATRPRADYFLLAGRLQAHKEGERIIRLFNELKLPLHVVGTGSQADHLRRIAAPNITFLGRVSDEILRDEYSGARALLYPQYEDFGLMPLEAAACGTATIARAAGGSLETVLPGQTGELFESNSASALREIIAGWDESRYQPTSLRQHARQFDKPVFLQNINNFLVEVAHAYRG